MFTCSLHKGLLSLAVQNYAEKSFEFIDQELLTGIDKDLWIYKLEA